MNYIGSKKSLTNFIYENITNTVKPKHNNLIFADLFAGTGSIGSYFRSNGYYVISNDIQYYSYILNKHNIENTSNKNFDLLLHLNSLKGVEGFIYNNYSKGSGSGRNYFTDENSKKCDAIRIELERLYRDNLIDSSTYYLYLASLLNSVDKVANTASVYGSFLKNIKKSASKNFILDPLPIINGPKGMVFNENSTNLIKRIYGDILYLDPPYNNRQYSSNYHLLETIARYDYPKIKGVTGIRDCEDQNSEFCYKNQAALALENIIANANFKYIFISYNNEGIIPFEVIKYIMSKYGDYKLYSTEYKRFKADKDCNRNILSNYTIEYLHCLIKDDHYNYYNIFN